jgi:hypothetical protein
MWRKTRTPGVQCIGVDPNRNWDDHWNGTVHHYFRFLSKAVQCEGSLSTVKCEIFNYSDKIKGLKINILISLPIINT